MSEGATLWRYWHTLRWLRPVQFYKRVWFRLYKPRPQLHPAPASRTPTGTWVERVREVRQLGPNTFRFIGEERTAASVADWNRRDWPKLWLYNLHYFDDLMAEGAADRRGWHEALLARWIQENPPVSGNGWEPYPTSLRVVNWLKWRLAGNTPVAGMNDSLAVQVRHLRRRLEHHLLGNHLWANLKALIFAGMCFQGREADSWRLQGLSLLRRELAEQVLHDGGHFERSPMYHAIVLEDLLDLIQLDQCYPGLLPEGDVAAWRTTAERMLRWLQVMTHPDGDIAFFNDAAMGIAPNLKSLDDYARSIGMHWAPQPLRPMENLAASGYVRLQNARAVLVLDMAPVGPDHLPGHAHADTLSFELSLDGRRVLVNGGTSTYAAGEQRQVERGTAMHNTVVVDGQDSSEVWSSFRVARRAKVHDMHAVGSEKRCEASAAHDGYHRLPGWVTHRRSWLLTDTGLVVTDTLDGRFDSVAAYFRMAPGLAAKRSSDTHGEVHLPEGRLCWQARGGDASVEEGFWHPRFGASEPCDVISLHGGAAQLQMRFDW